MREIAVWLDCVSNSNCFCRKTENRWWKSKIWKTRPEKRGIGLQSYFHSMALVFDVLMTVWFHDKRHGCNSSKTETWIPQFNLSCEKRRVLPLVQCDRQFSLAKFWDTVTFRRRNTHPLVWRKHFRGDRCTHSFRSYRLYWLQSPNSTHPNWFFVLAGIACFFERLRRTVFINAFHSSQIGQHFIFWTSTVHFLHNYRLKMRRIVEFSFMK